MEGAGPGDDAVEWVVKHKRFSLPVAVKDARRNRAPTANSSRARDPTYHSLASAPELIRRHWFVAPRSGSKKSTMAVVPPEEPHGDAGRPEPPRNWVEGSPASKSRKAPCMIERPICI